MPAFAAEAGVLSLHWIIEGHGYETTSRERLDVFIHIMRTAEGSGTIGETTPRTKNLVSHDVPGGAVRRALARVDDRRVAAYTCPSSR